MARARKDKSAADGIEVVNVSGAPSPNTELRPRGRALTPPPPAEPPSRRAPVQIEADSGQAFGASTRARSQQVFGEAIDRLSAPGECRLLANVLGVDGHEHHGQADEDSQLLAAP